MSIHPSQPRLISPMPRNRRGRPSRRLRLSQVGQVPQSRRTTGSSAPSTMPCFNPQCLRLPRSVNVKPTVARVNQSLKSIMGADSNAKGVFWSWVNLSFLDPIILPPESGDLFDHRCGTWDQPGPMSSVVALGIIFGSLISPDRCFITLENRFQRLFDHDQILALDHPNHVPANLLELVLLCFDLPA